MPLVGTQSNPRALLKAERFKKLFRPGKRADTLQAAIGEWTFSIYPHEGGWKYLINFTREYGDRVFSEPYQSREVAMAELRLWLLNNTE